MVDHGAPDGCAIPQLGENQGWDERSHHIGMEPPICGTHAPDTSHSGNASPGGHGKMVLPRERSVKPDPQVQHVTCRGNGSPIQLQTDGTTALHSGDVNGLGLHPTEHQAP